MRFISLLMQFIPDGAYCTVSAVGSPAHRPFKLLHCSPSVQHAFPHFCKDLFNMFEVPSLDQVEKKQRQAEQAAKSRAAAEEAHRQFIEKYGAPPPGMAPLPPAPTPPATPAPAEGDRGEEDEELLSATAQRQRQQQRAETVRCACRLPANAPAAMWWLAFFVACAHERLAWSM